MHQVTLVIHFSVDIDDGKGIKWGDKGTGPLSRPTTLDKENTNMLSLGIKIYFS